MVKYNKKKKNVFSGMYLFQTFTINVNKLFFICHNTYRKP